MSYEEFQRQESERWRVDAIRQFLKLDIFPRDMQSRTFENLDRSGENEQTIKMLEAWNSDEFGFLIKGPAGSGKTHLLHALLNKNIAQMIIPAADEYRSVNTTLKHQWLDTVRFETVSDFLCRIRRDIQNGGEFEIVQRAKYLFLDDLGAENITDWSRDELYRLFEFRLNNKLPTFITTNLNLEEIKSRLHERILSRLKELCVFVELKGRDRRVDPMKDRIQMLIERSATEPAVPRNIN